MTNVRPLKNGITPEPDKDTIIPCPEFKSFYFGLTICAFCLGLIPLEQRITKWLKKAEMSDDDVLVPRGYQAFHEGCWKKYKSFVGIEL